MSDPYEDVANSWSRLEKVICDKASIPRHIMSSIIDLAIAADAARRGIDVSRSEAQRYDIQVNKLIAMVTHTTTSGGQNG
jgi:hypothetical protein